MPFWLFTVCNMLLLMVFPHVYLFSKYSPRFFLYFTDPNGSGSIARICSWGSFARSDTFFHCVMSCRPVVTQS